MSESTTAAPPPGPPEPPEPGPSESLHEEALGDPRVLRIPAFRWVVVNHGVAGLGFWLYFSTLVAQATFVFDADLRELAILNASLSLPFVLGTVVQGLFIDRWSAKWLLFIGDLLIVGAVVVAWRADSLPMVYLSSLLVGLGAATLEPARSALTALLVPAKDLVRANGLIGIAFQVSLFLGTLMGGLLLADLGAANVYLIALVIMLAGLPFALMISDVRQQGDRPDATLRDLVHGLRTAWRLPELRLLLLITGSGWMLFNIFFVLEPIYIRNVLGLGESAVGLLWSAHGFGAIAGAIVVSRVKQATGKELLYVAAGVGISGIGLVIYAAFGIYALAFPGAALIGAGLSFMFPPALALVQRTVGDEEQGRVSGVVLSMQELMALSVWAVITIFAFPAAVAQVGLLLVAAAMGATSLLGLRAVRKLRRRDPAER